jgi:nucleotide-binding universal stress UspA family protein
VRRIVAGFDGSESARAALVWAVAESRLREIPLEVWTILESPPKGMPHTPSKPPAALAVQAAAAELTRGLAVEIRTGSGAAAAELCAASAGSDLLVVGSRGRSPFTDLLLGSVSRACLQHAPCSVVVVRTEPDPVQTRGTVVVGIDTSDHSRHALRVAAEEARLRGATLHALHAVHWDHLGVELIVPTTRQLLSWGKQLVEAELSESGVTARPVIVHGSPADVLVRHSERADLLVLGSRGHNPLAALALGSTSDFCVRHSACPVMVVRPSPEAPFPT